MQISDVAQKYFPDQRQIFFMISINKKYFANSSNKIFNFLKNAP